MATPQLSPGILVREIDLTVGRVDNVVNNIGGIAGPFQLGPVDEPIEVSNQLSIWKLSENHCPPTDSMSTGCLEVHIFHTVES